MIAVAGSGNNNISSYSHNRSGRKTVPRFISFTSPYMADQGNAPAKVPRLAWSTHF
jgi:hypothetical protein